MDRFVRPAAAASLVVAVVMIALLVGFPSWAAKTSATRAQAATAPPTSTASKAPPIDHAAGGHTATTHTEAIERGKHMYVRYCASCHGDTGQGDGPGGANLAVKPQNLTIGEVMNPLPNHFLHRIIAEGPQVVGLSSLMPPFKPQLGDRQIDEIIVYLRTLATPPYEADEVLPVAERREGPVQPILFSHVIHVGSYRLACQYCHSGARRSSDARGNGRTCAENFGVDAAWRDAPSCKAGGQIAHEGGGSTDVEVAIPRHAELPEHSHVQASGSVEIHTWPIPGIGRAVANVAAPEIGRAHV